MKPAAYWRATTEWKTWLGRRGKVIASTVVTVAAPDQEIMTPYSYAIIDFDNEKKEMMGAGHDVLVAGDEVECVLRKMSVGESNELISYGIKVRKVVQRKEKTATQKES